MNKIVLHTEEKDGLVYPLSISYPDGEVVHFNKEAGLLDMSRTKEFIGSLIQVISNSKIKFEDHIKDYTVVDGIGHLHFKKRR